MSAETIGTRMVRWAAQVRPGEPASGELRAELKAFEHEALTHIIRGDRRQVYVSAWNTVISWLHGTTFDPSHDRERTKEPSG